jgi:hypothetical protein
VNVDRPFGHRLANDAQGFGCNRPERMRGDTDLRVRQACRYGTRALDELAEPIWIIEEALLARGWRRATEAAIRIERWQQREADVGFRASSLSDWGLISICQQFCCGLSG